MVFPHFHPHLFATRPEMMTILVPMGIALAAPGLGDENQTEEDVVKNGLWWLFSDGYLILMLLGKL